MAAYRDDLDALASRHQALASEVAQKSRELDETTLLLEQARARARLPVLDNIRIASPCNADWEQMTGDDRVRACSLCNKNVFNLSELTREQAEALILDKEGDLCARYFQRADGTILLQDCSVGISRKRKRRVLAAGAVALLSGAVWATFTREDGTATVCKLPPPIDVTAQPTEVANESEVTPPLVPQEIDEAPPISVKMGRIARVPPSHQAAKDDEI